MKMIIVKITGFTVILQCNLHFKNNHLCIFIPVYVFKPSSPDIVYSKPSISKSTVSCAIFLPQKKKSSNKGTQVAWQQSSQLYFFNEEQELLSIVSEEEERKMNTLDSVSAYHLQGPRHS